MSRAPEHADGDFDLFGWAERQPEADFAGKNIRAAFLAFHAQQPEVYQLFERFTLEGVAAGMELLGAGAVWERMRWETLAGRRGPDGTSYRLNNNFRAYYARMFMDRHPELGPIFATRKVRS